MSVNTTLHFDMIGGISGDMSVGVLAGLGFDVAEAAVMVSRMTGREISASVEDVNVSGVMCKRLRLGLPHEHAHRTMKDIKAMIEASGFPDRVKMDAVGIFQIIADAEGAVHGKPADHVHFHEVGALDSIFDIVVFAYGVEKLGIKNITAGHPVLGTGFVKCAHGVMPVPAPATVKILEGVEIRPSDEPNEMTTPTGAAILKYYVKEFGSFGGKIINSSCSTGTKTFKTVPNMLRGVLLEQKSAEKLIMIETNIDDCMGEMLGHLFGVLSDVALDVSVAPITAKKNRPAHLVSVLCRAEDVESCAEQLFRHTSTAGVRFYPVDRIVMDREMVTVDVQGVSVDVKKLVYKDIVKFSPEWDSCVSAAEKLGISPMAVYDLAKKC